MTLTGIQWIKLITCWKIIDEKLKSYICNTHENILKKYNLIQLIQLLVILQTSITM